MTQATVLVVDDEKNIRKTLRLVLEGEGYRVLEAACGEDALTLLSRPETPVEALLLDIKLPGLDGLEVLERLRADDALTEMACLVMSGHASPSEAAQAIKCGALDFVEKPILRERLLVSLKNALAHVRAQRVLDTVSRETAARFEMVGDSPAMHKLFHEIERVGKTKASVLITGESGTGKELVSRAIHRSSPRADAPFVKVNCAAIPRELIESELFGHEKGAFTGAIQRKRGLFEQAHGGTLFLDEVGDMDLTAQAKLLRAVQSGEISRVGSEHTMHVDVRVLAATNRDLTRAVQEGSFREDLYFRLNVFPIRTPALRERREDIPLLVSSFLRNFWKENATKPKPVDAAVIERLGGYGWAGNVRELRNVVERMAILSDDRITVADLPDDPHANPFGDEDTGVSTLSEPPPDGAWESFGAKAFGEPAVEGGSILSLREVRERAERAYLIEVLRSTGWNISRTAVMLGVERTNLHKKIRSHGIRRGE